MADGLYGFLRLAEEVVEAGVAHAHKCLGRLVLAVAGVGAVVVHLPYGETYDVWIVPGV